MGRRAIVFVYYFRHVKKLQALILLLIFLHSQTELHQVARIPLLIEHYFEHQQKNHGMSFAEFLAMHYARSTKPDADHEKDMKLPFKSAECLQGSSLTFVSYHQEEVVFNLPVTSSLTFHNYISDWMPSSRIADIWQPPKVS